MIESSRRKRRMGREQDVLGLRTERVAIGLSAPIELTPIATQEGWLLKYPVLGGTLEICGSTGIAQGLSFPVQTWGSGYMMEVGESISVDGPASFYLRSAGATTVVHVVRTLTSGYKG
jgi:hypothetical protein